MDILERRALVLARQHLTRPGDVNTVCRDLNGMQAQFFSYARHALATRCPEPLEEGGSRELVKSWTVRGTMHLFHRDDLPLFLHRGRGHFLRDVDRFGDDPWVSGERKRQFAALILESIDGGAGEREELRLRCREAGMTDGEEQSLFNSWGGVLRAMSEEGMICYEAGEAKRFRRCPVFTPMEADKARLEMARRYFTHFGPATVKDAAYYFGCTQREVRGWLKALPVRSVMCEGRECFYIGEEEPSDIPRCILLAGFDQLMLGYEKKESIFLPPEHLRGVFNLSGIVMPCLLLDGVVSGRWKLSGRTCVVTTFRPFSAGEKELVEEQILRWFPETKTIRFEE